MPSARGSFEVNIEPEPPYLEDGGVKLNLNRVEKQYSGDMVGSARAHMLAAYTATPGSAGYVAIEHFSGTVNGKRGSLALQHSGTMGRGEAGLTVTVVPDSGTGELAGIAGTLELNSQEAGHTYVFEYELAWPEPARTGPEERMKPAGPGSATSRRAAGRNGPTA